MFSLLQLNTKIQEIDNDNNVNSLTFVNGIILWVITRYSIYHLLLKKYNHNQFYGAENVKHEGKNLLPGKLRIKSYVKLLINPIHKNKTDCVNIYPALNLIQKQDVFISKISGFLNEIEAFQTQHLIQNTDVKSKRKYAGRSAFYDYWLLKSKILSKIHCDHINQQNKGVIDEFITTLKNHLGEWVTEPELNNIKINLYSCARQMDPFEKMVRTYFKKVKPKIVMIEDGNLGSWDHTVIIKVAHENNIKTAELQHGILDIGYQFGKGLLDNETFRTHKTDFFLSFGSYHSGFIKSTSTVIPIGCQYLEQIFEKKKVPKRSPELTILFISQHNYTDNIIPILEKVLFKLSKSFKLFIKLHPLEKADIRKYKILMELPGVQVYHQENIYDLMSQSDVIIGSYSSALIESLGMDKTPFICKNSYSDHFIPPEVGLRFSNENDLLSLLNNEAFKKTDSYPIQNYFTPGCKENFMRFLLDYKILDVRN